MLTEDIKNRLLELTDNVYVSAEDLEVIKTMSEELQSDICITSEFEKGYEEEVREALNKEYTKARVLYKAIMKVSEEVNSTAALLEEVILKANQGEE